MSEQRKVSHLQTLKAVNHPIRREMLRFVNEVNKISKEDLLSKLKLEKILEKEDTFNYNMDFLIQALCIKKVAEQGKIFFEILPGGKVIESF
jgi:DNA-binding transcriptional ArsR family regulator